MDDLLAELKSEMDAAGVDADVEFSLPTLELTAALDATIDDTSQLHTDDPSHHYTDTPLTGDDLPLLEAWLDDAQLHGVGDDIIAEYIDEVLLVLITVRGGACGKELLQDVRRLFGADVSPGTMYPHLKQLADAGLLEMSELTKRKVYRVADAQAAIEHVDSVVLQLLTFAVGLQTIMADCIVNQSADPQPQDE
ncbi:gas vesicle transcriptional activator GvpE [Halobacterium salinarum]|uniref:gas vesicle transcriptional activator GvpE n=1 Tax=Halobacterium salinarum TaxID=2242 RepID=UPI0025563075|nr:gas vesicle transcriptional activator GvpE [Halobacterium salinarum]MDL0132828.1 gas vesicle transcriptional activator GvpE [Halobacterium salinarum]MDL0135298.1 gas vesicle transcriptional activator GvpE [Halobacterium salinarum]